jgi:hypothetical protein
MSGKILIIDIVSTNRIVLRVKMLASKYDVYSAHSKTRRFCSEMMRKLSVT